MQCARFSLQLVDTRRLLPEKPQTLDELMIAMDVVDTLRHREDLVRRELDEEGREAELIARLKTIYHDQGIEVPDHVLADGVTALKESRFVYTPPPRGWRRALLTGWARRNVYGRRAGIVGAVLAVALGGYYVLEVRPRQLAQEQARVELTETLPKNLKQAHANVLAVATDADAKQKADQLLADGERAIRNGDRADAAKAKRDLATLADDLTREYTLTIVSRAGGDHRRLAPASGREPGAQLLPDRGGRHAGRRAPQPAGAQRGDRRRRSGPPGSACACPRRSTRPCAGTRATTGSCRRTVSASSGAARSRSTTRCRSRVGSLRSGERRGQTPRADGSFLYSRWRRGV